MNNLKKDTRSAKGSGTIRKRKDGRWEARYTMGFDLKTGKQIQKSVYGKTQAEVRKKLTKIMNEIDEGTYLEPSKAKLRDWLAIWERDFIGNIKPATVKSYSDHVRLNINPYIGDVQLCKLTTPMVQRMYSELRMTKGLAPKTIKNIHGVLHLALHQAQKIGYIRTNPLEGIVLPRIEKKDIHPLEENELTEFLKLIKGDSFERVFTVAVFTGMREGETLGLTWDCVDFDKKTIYVCKQHGINKETREYEFSSLKNGKVRLLTVADGVMEVLQQQKQWQEEWEKRLGSSWENKDNFVFTNKLGEFLKNSTVYHRIKKYMNQMEIDRDFHTLRHTYAVDCLVSGDDVKTVQENLGHHSAAFTLNTYAHFTQGMRTESARRTDEFMKSVSG